MKQLISVRIVVAAVFSAAFLALFPVVTSAQVKEYVYDSIDVDVVVNEDSSAVVTEKLTQRFNGTFRGVFREITLTDSVALGRCHTNPNLQCGGFSFMELLGVYDGNGNQLPANAYTVEKNTDSGEERLRITWVFSENGRQFNNELFSYTVKYKVYGSIGYFPEYDLFYWDAIFPDRDVVVEDALVHVHFPQDINFNEENLNIPGRGFDYESSYNSETHTLNITADTITPFEDFTVLLKFPKGIIQEYASLNLTTSPDPITVSVNGIRLENVSSELSGIVPGETTLVFSASGYKEFTTTVNLAPGETANLEIKLAPSLATILFYAAIFVCNAVGLLALPVILLSIYRQYRLKGRDEGRSPIVVPEYSPPDKIRPYLLGSLKDEKVDIVDITATIIDVAFRGYIKIREFEAKSVLGIKLSTREYEFIKQKEFSDLSPVEQKILTGIFSGNDRVTTEDLKNSFYAKIAGINDAIYAEMVNRNYFPQRPDKVRNKYRGWGGALAVLGSFVAAFVFLLPFAATTAFTMVISGIVLLLVASNMPAKTRLGSKVFDKVLGFKMYMETAERFRVQDLTPETFEKYLSYAMVFGIENQWAERFKDIYKQPPDWFEASSTDRMLDTIYLTNALSNFNRVTTSTLTSSPSSSGSGWTSSGGGWSGGGGFSGGFSGGGGGGGGGGAF